jgi:hypothetical protein
VNDKIFIHTLHRSSSTYFLKQFESNKTLLFNEPFHEQNFITHIFNLKKNADLLNHANFLEQTEIDPIFKGYTVAFKYNPELMNHHSEKFDIINYLERKLKSNEIKFLSSLIDSAFKVGKMPVLGFVRSIFRVSQIRKEFGGFHIAQIKNPYSVWGSYWSQYKKGNTYFIAYSLKLYCFHINNEIFKFANPISDKYKKEIEEILNSDDAYQVKLCKFENIISLLSIEDQFKIFIYLYILGNINSLMYSDDFLLIYDSNKSEESIKNIKNIVHSKFKIDLSFENLKQTKNYVYYSDMSETLDNILMNTWNKILYSPKNILSLLAEYNSNEPAIRSFEETIAILKNFLEECSNDYQLQYKKNQEIASEDIRYLMLKNQLNQLQLEKDRLLKEKYQLVKDKDHNKYNLKWFKTILKKIFGRLSKIWH